MKQIDAAGILDIVISETVATQLARLRQSALLVNVDKFTLAWLMANNYYKQVGKNSKSKGKGKKLTSKE